MSCWVIDLHSQSGLEGTQAISQGKFLLHERDVGEKPHLFQPGRLGQVLAEVGKPAVRTVTDFLQSRLQSWKGGLHRLR